MYTCKDGGQPSHIQFFQLCKQGVGLAILLCVALHCLPQTSLLPALTLLLQVFSVWELFFHPLLCSLPLPHSVSSAGLLKAGGLCADVPGERPAPLPWENMWSGSVYAGTLSSCLPHSMLASVSPGWQCSTLFSQRGHSQVEVTTSIRLIYCLDKQECK